MIAYICSPYRAETETQLDNHIDYAQQLTKLALKAGSAPITTHLYITQVTNDNNPQERLEGMAAGQELLRKCNYVLAGNKYGLSEGMQVEIEIAEALNIPVIIDDGTLTPAELQGILAQLFIEDKETMQAAGAYADMPALQYAT